MACPAGARQRKKAPPLGGAFFAFVVRKSRRCDRQGVGRYRVLSDHAMDRRRRVTAFVLTLSSARALRQSKLIEPVAKTTVP